MNEAGIIGNGATDNVLSVNDTRLLRLDDPFWPLAEVKTIQQGLDTRAKAAAIKNYAREIGDKEMEICAIIGGYSAERVTAELIERGRKEGWLATNQDNRHTLGVRAQDTYKCTFTDLDIDRRKAAAWAKWLRFKSEETFKAEARRLAEWKADLSTDKAMKSANIAANSEDDEGLGDGWCTPEEVIDAAREVMGEIDLDPASNDEAQEIVKAKLHFTRETNGLAHDWNGRIFLNPPYSYPLVEEFANKLLAEYHAKRVKQAVVLVNNCTDADWFQALANECITAFTRDRCKFWRPGDDGTFGARQGQAIFYAGPKREIFVKVFGHLVYVPNWTDK